MGERFITRRQDGFALLELAVAALIATLLAVWGANTLARRLDEANAQSMAAWMLAVRSGAQAYMQRHGARMARASGSGDLASEGFQDWLRPSLPELKAAGLLPQGFPENGPGGMRAAIRLLPDQGCPGDECLLQALVHGAPAMLRRYAGQVDEHMTALWLLASGGFGGVVDRRRPDTIRGASFGFSNPPAPDMPALPEGTPVMAVMAGQAGDARFLRVGDERDPNFQGTATVRGNIRSEGSVAAGEYLFAGAQHAVRMPCGQEGAVAREAYRGLLVCQGGSWRSAGGRGGGGFSTNSLHGCATPGGLTTANPVTGACSCPPGHAMVTISDSGSAASPEGRTRGYLCVE